MMTGRLSFQNNDQKKKDKLSFWRRKIRLIRFETLRLHFIWRTSLSLFYPFPITKLFSSQLVVVLETMTATTEWLQMHDGDVEQLVSTFDLTCNVHPHLPLVVLNYRRGMQRKTIVTTVQTTEEKHCSFSQQQVHHVVAADDPIVAECRGLVIEVDACKRFVAIIAKPFQRFWHIRFDTSGGRSEHTDLSVGSQTNAVPQLRPHPLADANSHFNFSQPFELQEKEDGTFMLLYWFRDRWIVSSRNGFGQEQLSMNGTSRSKSEWVLHTIFDETNELSSYNKQSMLDTAYTYCIEFCSPHNQIVRYYASNKVFLVGIVHRGGTWSEVQPSSQVDSFVHVLRQNHGIHFERPWIHRDCLSFDDAERVFHERIAVNSSTEGVVLVDTDGRRLKWKTQLFNRLHKLKYLGWVTCTPSFCVPLMIRGEMDPLIAMLPAADEARATISRRVASFQRVLDRAFSELCSTWQDMISLSNERCKWMEYLGACKHKFRPILFALIARQQEWQLEHGDGNACAIFDWKMEAYRLFNSNPHQLIRWFFGSGDVVPQDASSQSHIVSDARELTLVRHPVTQFQYCRIRDLALDELQEKNDGIAVVAPCRSDDASGGWQVQCYCGEPMELQKLKYYLYVPRQCHCGWNRDGAVKTYVPRSLLWICTRDTCGLTMEAHQSACKRNGKSHSAGDPLGVPASALCKSLRLIAHDLLRRLPFTRVSDQYQWLAVTLNVPEDILHMSQMSVRQCAVVISALQVYLHDSNGGDGGTSQVSSSSSLIGFSPSPAFLENVAEPVSESAATSSTSLSSQPSSSKIMCDNNTTALAIEIIDVAMIKHLNHVRSQYDRAHPRWPPHVTLVFGFVPPEHLDYATCVVRAALVDVPAFKVSFRDISHFKSRRTATFHLTPLDSVHLLELHRTILQALENAGIRVVMRHHFTPHLTLGQCSSIDIPDMQRVLSEWRDCWPESTFTWLVDHVSVLHKSESVDQSNSSLTQQSTFKKVATIDLCQPHGSSSV